MDSTELRDAWRAFCREDAKCLRNLPEPGPVKAGQLDTPIDEWRHACRRFLDLATRQPPSKELQFYFKNLSFSVTCFRDLVHRRYGVEAPQAAECQGEIQKRLRMLQQMQGEPVNQPMFFEYRPRCNPMFGRLSGNELANESPETQECAERLRQKLCYVTSADST